jgi:hypothetical protein
LIYLKPNHKGTRKGAFFCGYRLERRALLGVEKSSQPRATVMSKFQLVGAPLLRHLAPTVLKNHSHPHRPAHPRVIRF